MATSFVFDIDGYLDDQTQRVVLDDKTYEFRFQYNYRDESWSCFVGPVAGKPACSFKITSFTDDYLKAYHYNESVPQGKLYAAPLNNPRARVGRYNLGKGKEVELWYNSQD